MEWFFDDSNLYKINEQSEMFPLGESLKEFINTVIYEHPNCCKLLPQLSDIHVLVVNKSSENYLREGDLPFKDILGEEKYEFLEKHGKYIIGWMSLEHRKNKEENDIHFIDFIDSTIKGHNIAQIMINKYKQENEVSLFPEEIIPSSAKYWSKKMIIEDEEGSIYKQDIDQFIEENSIDKDRIKWDSLYEICVDNEVNHTDSDYEDDSDEDGDDV